MADDDSALWLAGPERPQKRQKTTHNLEIESLLSGLNAADFDDGQHPPDSETQQSLMIGSAEVPAETQGELLDVYTCSTKTGGLGDPDDDDELYWANETQDETELILKATQELEQEAEFPVFRSSAFQPIPDPPKQQKSNLQFSKEPVQADHENGQEQQRSQPSNRNTPSESSSQLSQYRDQELPPIMQPNHFDTANTTFAGFQTGRGATMAPPSSAALRKACAMLASSPLESGAQTENQNEDERSAGEQSEDEDEDSQQLMPPPAFMPSRNAQQASKGSPLQIMLNGDITSSPAHEEEDTAANISFGLSFQTARGKTLNDPSNESMERARRLIAPSSSPETLPGSQQHQQQRLTEAEATDSPTVNRQRDARNALKRPPMILRLAQLGDPSASAPASPATLRPRPHTLSAYGETPVRSRGTQRQSLPLLPPPRSVFKTPQQLGSSHSARCAESKTVLQIRPTNQTSMPGPRTPCTPGVKLAIRAPLKPSTTPAEPPRRVNNQMHGSARRQMPKGAFKPPFKNGVRPPPGPILSQSSSQQDPTTEAAGQLVLSKHAARLPTSQRQGFDDRRFTQPSSRQRNGKFKAVFDLSDPPCNRQDWQDAAFTLGLSALALEALGIDKQIIYMDSRSGIDYAFMPIDGSAPLAWQDAHEQMQARGAKLVDVIWVQNHWPLILWKQAGILKATVSAGKSDELSNQKIWSFETVLTQLLYRYEREINLAQRSAIKRIQEQDSSAAQAMVLVVSDIYWTFPDSRSLTAPPELGEGNASQTAEHHHPTPPQISGIELTDGWYRINAQIDPVLDYAIRCGKLRVGCKLLTVGAKLEADREGSDVLEAQSKSMISIAANSTRQAHWTTKLGFQRPAIYVSALRSLSPLGGPVPMIDIKVLKLYPLGFIENGEEGWEKGPWNRVEEEEKQRIWMRQRAHAEEKALENLRRQQEDLNGLSEILESASRKALPQTKEMAGDLDDFIEELLEDRKQRARLLGGRSRQFLQESANRARTMAHRLIEESHEALRLEIEDLCPERSFRSFRVARVHDAADPRSANLEALLTLWDPAMLEELSEGHRYTVTNVRPCRPNSWSRWDIPEGEIFLSAGRNSVFQRKSSSILLLKH